MLNAMMEEVLIKQTSKWYKPRPAILLLLKIALITNLKIECHALPLQMCGFARDCLLRWNQAWSRPSITDFHLLKQVDNILRGRVNLNLILLF
jgi:hypothetical protein